MATFIASFVTEVISLLTQLIISIQQDNTQNMNNYTTLSTSSSFVTPVTTDSIKSRSTLERRLQALKKKGGFASFSKSEATEFLEITFNIKKLSLYGI